jgi:hypothetical protein
MQKIRVVYNPSPETSPLEGKNSEFYFNLCWWGSYVKGKVALNTLKRRSCVSFLLTGRFKREHEALVRKLNDTFREALLA